MMGDDPALPTISILGVPFHSVTMDEAVRQIGRLMEEERVHQVVTVNPEFVMTAQEDAETMDLLQRAELSLADGVGILYAARWRGSPLPERVAGSDLIFRLAAEAAREGWRIFLLGAAPGVAEETAAILCAAYPGLRIAGTYAGSPAPEQNEAIVERINRSRADLLFVAYGVPQEEKWIDRNRSRLETVRVAIGVGGAFDFVAGRTVRAPEWVQRVGLEWAHRLLRQPWRWRRMLALPHFTLRVLRTRRREP